MSALRTFGRRTRQRGVGIVETMVGILIGLLVVLVIYNLLSAAEGFKRMSVGASDAQVSGLLSQFVLARDAGNGGNGVSLAAPDLINCTATEAGAADWQLRPIPVLITDSAAPDVSDSFIATTSGSPRVLWPVDFTADAIPGANFVVQTPNGFSSPTPAVTPYRAVVMANDGTGRCKLLRVTNATPPDAQGRVTLTHTPNTITYTAAAPARLLNLGPVGMATRVLYEITNAQLRSTDLYDAIDTGVLNPNPLAANIVLMKAQYGIDKDGDEIVDCWTPANTPGVTGDPCADGKNYSDAGVRAFNLADLNRILAVRIAVVVRSDEPDLKDNTLTAAYPRPPVVLFNCAANDATCQSAITLPAGPASIIQDFWRYRTYETVIPLRNVIFNATLP